MPSVTAARKPPHGLARPDSAAPQRQTRSRRSLLLHRAAKPVLFAACALPFAWLFYAAWADALGANPAQALIDATGDWTLRFLCLTLAVTPLRELTHQPALARFRRMLGLFTFFYVCLHFLSYAGLDMGFDPHAIARDIPKRPFALVGFTAFLLMIPLAATSFNRAIRALGASRWQRLHKLVYVIALLGLLHLFWVRAGKNHFTDFAIYAGIIALLLGWRIVRAGLRARRLKRTAAPGRTSALGPAAADRLANPVGRLRSRLKLR